MVFLHLFFFPLAWIALTLFPFLLPCWRSDRRAAAATDYQNRSFQHYCARRSKWVFDFTLRRTCCCCWAELYNIYIWTWTSPVVVCAGQQLRVENSGPSIVLFFFFGGIQLIRLIQMRIKTKNKKEPNAFPRSNLLHGRACEIIKSGECIHN